MGRGVGEEEEKEDKCTGIHHSFQHQVVKRKKTDCRIIIITSRLYTGRLITVISSMVVHAITSAAIN